VLVLSVQFAVFVGLLLLHVFNDELQQERITEERVEKKDCFRIRFKSNGRVLSEHYLRSKK